MKLSLVLQTAAAAALAAAQPVPNVHAHHAHKRDVVHVTETVLVTVDADAPFNAPAPVQTAVGEQTDGTATQYAYQVTQAPAAAPVNPDEQTQAPAPAAATTAATADAAPAQNKQASVAPAPVSASAGTVGITYSPYNSDGTCKSLSAVQSDLATLGDYAIIRLYGVDCNQIANVFQAKKSSQKLFLGIFDVSDISGAVSNIAAGVKAYGSWDDVYTVSVGNELVNMGSATPAQIGQYVAQARSDLQAAGYSGPVVSVDTHVAILANPELCQYSDYIAFNAHAYWDGTVSSGDAGPWLLLQMQRVANECGKHVMCVESGWPHSGGNNGVAVASPSDQTSAMNSLSSVCGNDVLAFTGFDDLWKNPGPNGVEQFWGIFH